MKWQLRITALLAMLAMLSSAAAIVAVASCHLAESTQAVAAGHANHDHQLPANEPAGNGCPMALTGPSCGVVMSMPAPASDARLFFLADIGTPAFNTRVPNRVRSTSIFHPPRV